MKKNISVIILFIISLWVSYWLVVDQSIENAVSYIKRIIFTTDGTDQWDQKVVIDGVNGSIAMSWELNIQEWALKDFSVVTNDIKDGVITNTKIANETITSDKLAENSVWASELADNSVDTYAIQDNSITSEKIVNGSIKAEDIDPSIDLWWWVFQEVGLNAVYTGWNVGIWITNPIEPLHINQVDDPSDDKWLLITEDNNSQKIEMHLADNSNWEYWYLYLGWEIWTTATQIRWNWQISNFGWDVIVNWIIKQSGIIIEDYNSWRRWSDGTYARSCKDYRFPTWNYKYDGSIWDGYYWIKPYKFDAPINVYCDMTTDGWWYTRYVQIKWNYSFSDAWDCVMKTKFINNSTLFCFDPYLLGSVNKILYKWPWYTYLGFVWQYYDFSTTRNSYKRQNVFDCMYWNSAKYCRFGYNYDSNDQRRNPWGVVDSWNRYMNWYYSDSRIKIWPSWSRVYTADRVELYVR